MKKNITNNFFNTQINNLIIENDLEQAIDLLKGSYNTTNINDRSLLLLHLLDQNFNNYDDINYYSNDLINYSNISKIQLLEVRHFLAKRHLEQGEYAKAKEQLKRLKRCSYNEVRSNALLEEAILMRKSLNFNDATEFLFNNSKNINNSLIDLELGHIYKLNNYFNKSLFHYSSIDDRYKGIRDLSIIYLYIKYNKFEEAKKFIEQNNINSNYITNLIGAKLDNNIQPSGYLMNQLLNYNKNECLSHIKKHCLNNNDKSIHSIFDSKFDIESNYEKYNKIIKKNLPISEDLTQNYIIQENDIIGKVNIFNTNKILVITDFNKNIINMYPILSTYHYNLKKSDNLKNYFYDYMKSKKYKKQKIQSKHNNLFNIYPEFFDYNNDYDQLNTIIDNFNNNAIIKKNKTQSYQRKKQYKKG